MWCSSCIKVNFKLFLSPGKSLKELRKRKKYKKNRSNVHQIRWILVEYYSPRKILYHRIQPLFLNLAYCMVSLFLNLVYCMVSLFLNLAYCNMFWWHCNSHRCHFTFLSLQQCILINSINLQKKVHQLIHHAKSSQSTHILCQSSSHQDEMNTITILIIV